MKKKFYVPLLLCSVVEICANAQTSWNGTSAVWTSGEGTVGKPYLIENGQHMAYLSESVRRGETFEGKYFKLMNDLDMGASSDKVFTPIGFFDEYTDSDHPENGNIDNSKYFSGVFDGNFKKIDNIRIYYEDDTSVGGTGLFACISEESVIRNVRIGSQSVIEGGDLTGAIVGCMKGGLIENCCNEASVEGEGVCIGGLVGSGEKGRVQNSYNTGNITGATSVGGIVGDAALDITINNCYNKGKVSASGLFIGGIVGALYAGTVTNCYNIGAVTKTEEGIGLFMQAVVGSTDIDPYVIRNCYYEPDMSTVPDENDGVTAKAASEMKSDGFPAILNDEQPSPWIVDRNDLNDGFPILVWQDPSGPDGIQKEEIESECDVYSYNHSVYVNLENPSKTCQIVVSDFEGKIIVDETLVSGGSVKISRKGIYIVMVKADRQCLVRKIVIN